MIAISGWLVIIKDDRLAAIIACAVEPHVGLCLWLFAFFFQHLDRCFITMDDITGKKNLPHMFHNRKKIILRAPDDPVRHGRSGKSDSHPFPVLFLAVKRYAVHVLLMFCSARSTACTVCWLAPSFISRTALGRWMMIAVLCSGPEAVSPAFEILPVFLLSLEPGGL